MCGVLTLSSPVLITLSYFLSKLAAKRQSGFCYAQTGDCGMPEKIQC